MAKWPRYLVAIAKLSRSTSTLLSMDDHVNIIECLLLRLMWELLYFLYVCFFDRDPCHCRFSVGAAMTMLVTWLEALHLAWVWGEDPPETIVVVTGKGKHSKNMESALKAQIESQLSQLSSPFTQCGDNSGRLSASGTALQDWLLSPGIKQRLSLVDTTSPRPSYNNGLEKWWDNSGG